VDVTRLEARALAVGDQVDCWRPRMHVSNISVAKDVCGQPVCTLEHIYSCVTENCVQLTSPATQFLSVFRGRAALLTMGKYFGVSGGAIAFIMSFMELCSPERDRDNLNVVIMIGAVIFLVVTCAILLLDALLAELRWVDFIEEIAPRIVRYLFELVALAFVTCSLSALKNSSKRVVLLVVYSHLFAMIVVGYVIGSGRDFFTGEVHKHGDGTTIYIVYFLFFSQIMFVVLSISFVALRKSSSGR